MSKTKELTDKYVMNTYSRLPLVIERGDGVYLYDEDGKKYLDFTAGIAVNSLGYGNKKFIEALTKQSELFNHCSNLYYSKPQAEVAEILVKNSCFDRVFFCNSGAEAVESALKLSKKYGKEKRTKIISMKNSFHGRTCGSLSLTGQTKYQKGFAPLVPDIVFAEYNNIESVKAEIDENVCAIIVEPIQGEGGLTPAKKDFLAGLREICDKNDILLIFDEVQCGMGRTGKLFAYQHFGVEPDVACLAKGLGNGFPIGAMLAKEKAASAFEPGNHASTFGGNPLATVCAKVVLSELTEGNILKNVVEVGDYLKQKLNELKAEFPVIKEVRGYGLMQGIELDKPVKEIIAECQQNGLLLIGAGENVLRFIPPLIVTKEHVDEAIAVLRNVNNKNTM